MTTTEEIGLDFVEALEEIGTLPQGSEEEFNEYMKTRRGLAGMLATYPPYVSVEVAIAAERQMWCEPI